MEQGTSIDIAADASRVWQVMADVERWPQWTSTVTSLRLLDAAPLRLGSRAVIEQPRMPRLEWTVTRLEDGREFVWESTSPGVRTVARHAVEPIGEGRTRATLSIEQHGPLSGVASLMYRRLGDRYLATEAAGLKATAETPA